jgi:hypothetical protein
LFALLAKEPAGQRVELLAQEMDLDLRRRQLVLRRG